jgi:hypothetical protein
LAEIPERVTIEGTSVAESRRGGSMESMREDLLHSNLERRKIFVPDGKWAPD